MKRNVTVCFCMLLCAGTGLSQTVTESTVSSWAFSIDTAGTIEDPGILSGDPSLAPFVLDRFAELAEPIMPPFGGPSFHRAKIEGELEALGSVWSGSALSSVEYPDTLDLGVNYGDQNTISGSVAFISHTVSFTLAQPTSIQLQAMFRTDQIDPFNPSIIDGFTASIKQGDTTLLTTDFDALANGIDQAFDDAAVLAAGEYEFRIFSNLAALETLGYRSATSSFDYTLTFVPAPASSTLLIGATFMMRRRRY